MGAGAIIYWHRERRPQLLSGQTRPISTGQEISRTASDYEREGEQVNKQELLNLPMVICKGCGWEIGRGQIEPICEDCEQVI